MNQVIGDRVLVSFAFAACAASTGCGLFHWCVNGAYGRAHYERTVRAVPDGVSDEAGSARGLYTEAWCRRACDDHNVKACEPATVSGTAKRVFVCHSYREGGCPSY